MHPGVDPRQLLLFGLLALVIFLAWIIGRRYGRRRTEGLTAIATQLGFTFGPKGQVIPEWRRLRLFRWGGKQKRIEYVLRGRRGSADVALFDFTIPSMSPDAGTAITRTVASFRMPGKAFPRFSLEPTSLIGRLPAWLLTPLGGVKFDSNPKFSRHFLVDSRPKGSSDPGALHTRASELRCQLRCRTRMGGGGGRRMADRVSAGRTGRSDARSLPGIL